MSNFYTPEQPSPLPAGAPELELKSVRCALKQGRKWLFDGFVTFTRNPGNWLIVVIFYSVLAILLALVPVAGWIALILITPVLLGGLMLGCHQLWQQRNFHSRYIFTGFETHAKPLLLLGFWYLLLVVVTLVIVAAILLLVGNIDFRAVLRASTAKQLTSELFNDPLSLMACIISAAVLFFGLFLSTCGLWLSPTLVVLGRASPWRAFRLSLIGCFKNLLPLLWLNIIVIACVVALVLPLLMLVWLLPSFAFGGYLIAAIVLLSLLPAMIVAMYGMSRDVFPALQYYDLTFD